MGSGSSLVLPVHRQHPQCYSQAHRPPQSRRNACFRLWRLTAAHMCRQRADIGAAAASRHDERGGAPLRISQHRIVLSKLPAKIWSLWSDSATAVTWYCCLKVSCGFRQARWSQSLVVPSSLPLTNNGGPRRAGQTLLTNESCPVTYYPQQSQCRPHTRTRPPVPQIPRIEIVPWQQKTRARFRYGWTKRLRRTDEQAETRGSVARSRCGWV